MNLLIFNALSWEQRKLAELVTRYEDPVETPHDGYIRLGIRSHAKGTFHEYVEPGHELETAQMHRVAANKLIFNIISLCVFIFSRQGIINNGNQF